jgi:putative redox protein
VPQQRAVRLEWTGERLQFTGGGTEPQTPSIAIDGDGAVGPSPMLALLLAAAGCSAADVVVILKKMRIDLMHLSVEVEGTRRDEEPRRYTDLTFRFRAGGPNLARDQVERAVELSLGKYCSVVHSLAPDIDVRHEIELV